jgi:hypothetical protein
MFPHTKSGLVYLPKKLPTDSLLKMKIAVCLYGLPRGNKHTWASLIDAICKPLEADLYIHTWMLKEQVLTHTGLPQPKRLEALTLASFFLLRYARTKSVSIDYQQQHSPVTISKPWGLVYWSNQVNMFLSLSRVSYISGEFDSYDAVIFTRSDIYFRECISLQTLKDIPCGLSHGGIKQKEVGVDFDDVFFIIKNKNPTDIFRLILNGYSSKFYKQNNIYNIIPHRCAELGMKISKLKYEYGSSFYIYRSYSIRRIKDAIFRRLKYFAKKF